MARWFDYFPEHAPAKPKRTAKESMALADLWIADQRALPATKKPRGKARR